ncbi:non-hydrolyzing UDP-N-acetylglucosamine 2-epimerase [Massilia sp. PWRC2]|uniref:non-hydrolyzing UDP-N-acetylglucosamine 2-epimerase n=1 Tax=Massilia sp. PWRC2 TaxID=2804626 RepID=UPI003CE80D91
MQIHKILTVLGARPQFIKASAVSTAIAASQSLREVIVHTGQHFDANMSDVFFEQLDLRKPDYHCNIHGGSHGTMTGRMLIEVDQILRTEAPDVVMVYGDTNSTLAGALAAAKLDIPVAHVEAGLRSFNMAMPEEINRILTDRVSRWLFAPTRGAAAHLEREGANPTNISVVGDVMFDVALRHGERCRSDAGLLGEFRERYGIYPGNYCLATVHRAESTCHPERLHDIVDALAMFSKQMPVVFPLHPRTRTALSQLGALERLAACVLLIEPLAYFDMVQLEKYAAIIATDSGGVQKEAFFYQVPCVTLRSETEWTELVDAGWNRLALPGNASAILASLCAALGSRGTAISPYGDGKAAEHIVNRLEGDLTDASSRRSRALPVLQIRQQIHSAH